MTQPIRTALLAAAALLMLFGAFANAFVLLPDLHGDLIEIGVRPSVLGTTVVHLQFAAMVMFGFGIMAAAAAAQSLRGGTPARFPLAVVAIIYVVFGVMEYSRSRNPHHLGPVAMGVLLGAAIAMPNRQG